MPDVRGDIELDVSASGAPAVSGEISAVPRILIFPPADGADGIDPVERSLARSLMHDVYLTLCKSRRYEIIAPFTALQLVGGEPPASTLAADYHVRTDLIPRATDYSFLWIEVVDTRSGRTIYNDTLQLSSGLLLNVHFGLCDILVERISSQVAREELVQFRRTGAASAYVHYLLAMEYRDRTDLPSLLRAQKSLLRSMQLSPDYVPALSQLARTKVAEWLQRGTSDRTLLLEARHLAERAQLYEPQDSGSLREVGHTALYLHDLDLALASYEAAEASAPNHADLLADQADVLTHASRHDEAENRVRRALALNPLAPDDYYWIAGGVSFFRGKYEEALQRLTTMKSPGLALRLMAASAAMNGNTEAAASYRIRALERDPAFAIDKWTSRYPQPNKADTDHYLDALKLAGFPTS